jgi:hypothetical protein
MVVKSYSEQVRFLISRKFPDYWKLQQNEVKGDVGSNSRAQELHSYTVQLQAMPNPDRDALYVQEVLDEKKEQEEAQDRADQLRFFNEPTATANFDFSCVLDSWELEEAAALLLGKDPAEVSWSRLKRHVHESPFARRFEKLLGQLRRARADGKMKSKDTPAVFVGWAKSIGIPLPPEITSRIAETEPGSRVETRERKSLLRIVLGMAKTHYKYDAEAPKSVVPKQMAGHLSEAACAVGHETIRGYLQEAAKMLPTKSE